MSGYHPEGILDNIVFGLRVWLKEMKWMSKASMRRFEISRLEKQLEEEYVHLGRIAEAPRGKKEEKDLVLKQIKFLKDEIATLEQELEQNRMRHEGEPQEKS